MVLTDVNANATDTLTIAMSDATGTLTGDANLTKVDATHYTLTGDAATVQSELQALTFKFDAGHAGATTTFSLTDHSVVGEQSADTAAATTVTVTDTDPMVAPTITQTLAFATQATFGTGPAPQYMTVGDFNNDGKQDLATPNKSDGTVSILLGNGNGTFQQEVSYATGNTPVGISVGDFNHDGALDIAVPNTADNTVSILLGNGDGTFLPQVTYPTGNFPFSVSVADVDKNGIPDLIVTNIYANNVSVLLGNGDGTFQSQMSFAAGSEPNNAMSADFNKDGNPDIIVTDNIGNDVSVLLGNGDGTFQTPVTYAVGAGPTGVATGDFNHDGNLDIVVANFVGNTISVLLGNGDGTFRSQTQYETGLTPNVFSVADMNGDGYLDIVVQDYGANVVSVLLGNGDGTFQPQKTFAVGYLPGAVAVTDLNGDGQPDIVAANIGDNTVSVLLNTTTGQTTDSSTPINPFANMVLTDANANATDTLTIAMSDATGTLAGDGLTNNQDGTYTLTGDAATVQSELQALSFKFDPGHAGATTTFSLTDHSVVGEQSADTAAATTVTVKDTDVAVAPAHVAAIDFNGDGHSDVLLQNTADGHGEYYTWELNGTGALAGFGAVGWTPPSDANNNWVFAGTGDFNGDGKSDILLENTATGHGECFIWELNGTGALVGSGLVGWTPPSDANNNWLVKGTGDFNGDGNSDILLQNTADGHGEYFIWEMNGTGALVGSGTVGWTPPSDADNKWVFAATGDFNGDGKSDILLQNTAAGHGEYYVWELDGTKAPVDSGVVGWTPPIDANNNWVFAATGDFNGDGKSDILLHNTAAGHGEYYVWELDGTKPLVGSGTVGWTPPSDANNNWEVKGTGDYNGDGKSDILLQNTAVGHGECYIWEVNGTNALVGSGLVGWTPPTADWHATA